MIEQLINYFERFITLDEFQKTFIRENLQPVKFSKKEILLRAGDVSKAFWFLLDGCARMFYE